MYYHHKGIVYRIFFNYFRLHNRGTRWVKNHWWIFIVLIIGALVSWAIYESLGGYIWPAWTGFSDYSGPLTKEQRGKTLWDWMQLLVIPLVLALGALWFNWFERKKEKELAVDLQREAALQSYIDRMSELLLENDLRNSNPESETRKLARTRTLATLRKLDPVRTGFLIRFLHEAGLITKDNPIISLRYANLSYASLRGVSLPDTNLALVDLSKADLRRANLIGTNLTGATLIDADLFGANLDEANLFGADLSKADMRMARLTGTIMPEGKH